MITKSTCTVVVLNQAPEQHFVVFIQQMDDQANLLRAHVINGSWILQITQGEWQAVDHESLEVKNRGSIESLTVLDIPKDEAARGGLTVAQYISGLPREAIDQATEHFEPVDDVGVVLADVNRVERFLRVPYTVSSRARVGTDYAREELVAQAKSDHGDIEVKKAFLSSEWDEHLRMIKAANLDSELGSPTRETDNLGYRLDERMIRVAHGLVLGKKGPEYERLVSQGADVDGKRFDPDGIHQTPLCRALANNEIQLTRWLLENGADPNRRTGDAKLTPLWIATEANSPQLVDALLEYGADPSLAPGCVRMAAGFHNAKIIDSLCSHGADPDDVRRSNEAMGDPDHSGVGVTSCHEVIYSTGSSVDSRKNAADCLKVLIGHGASLDIPSTNAGETAAQLIASRHIPGLIEAVEEARATLSGGSLMDCAPSESISRSSAPGL